MAGRGNAASRMSICVYGVILILLEWIYGK